MQLVKTVILLALFSSTQLLSQEETTPVYKEWILFSFGLAAEHDLSASISYNFGKSRFYQVGFYSNADYSSIGSGPSLNLITVSLGKRYFEKELQASFYLGPSYAWVVEKKPSGIGQRKSQTIGLLANVQVIGKPAKGFGVGGDFFANISASKPALGIRLAILLGNGK